MLSMGKSTIMGYHVNYWFYNGLMGYNILIMGYHVFIIGKTFQKKLTC